MNYEPDIHNIPIVRDFPDIFLNSLLGMPPERKIEFPIDLLPSTALISKTLYQMFRAELKELGSQLQELHNKGFIWHSTFPWVAPVLFVKKEKTFHMCIAYRDLNLVTTRVNTQFSGLMICLINYKVLPNLPSSHFFTILYSHMCVLPW